MIWVTRKKEKEEDEEEEDERGGRWRQEGGGEKREKIEEGIKRRNKGEQWAFLWTFQAEGITNVWITYLWWPEITKNQRRLGDWCVDIAYTRSHLRQMEKSIVSKPVQEN